MEIKDMTPQKKFELIISALIYLNDDYLTINAINDLNFKPKLKLKKPKNTIK